MPRAIPPTYVDDASFADYVDSIYEYGNPDPASGYFDDTEPPVPSHAQNYMAALREDCRRRQARAEKFNADNEEKWWVKPKDVVDCDDAALTQVTVPISGLKGFRSPSTIRNERKRIADISGKSVYKRSADLSGRSPPALTIEESYVWGDCLDLPSDLCTADLNCRVNPKGRCVAKKGHRAGEFWEPETMEERTRKQELMTSSRHYEPVGKASKTSSAVNDALHKLARAGKTGVVNIARPPTVFEQKYGKQAGQKFDPKTGNLITFATIPFTRNWRKSRS